MQLDNTDHAENQHPRVGAAREAMPGAGLSTSAPMPDRAAIETDLKSVHAVAAHCCKTAGVTDGRLILTAIDEHLTRYPGGQVTAARTKVLNEPFPVGDWQAMADRAFALTLQGCGVYRPLVVYGGTIPANKRPSENALFAFGLGADLDADKANPFSPDELPLTPGLLTCSSMVPAVNLQPSFLFDRDLPIAQTKRLAVALKTLVGDLDSATSDPTRVWRIAGSLNWPNLKKFSERQRPFDPQLVTADPRGTGELLSPDDLAAVLGVALVDQPRQPATMPEPSGPDDRTYDGAGLNLSEGAPSSDSHAWQGTVAELTRLYRCLRAIDRRMVEIRAGTKLPLIVRGYNIDISDRDYWRRCGMALHHFFDGGQRGLDLWAAVTAGDASYGLVGYPPCYDAAEMADEYESFRRINRPITIGTVFDVGIHCGFDARRTGLPPLPRKLRQVSDGGREVEAMAALFNGLSPKERYRAIKAVRHRAAAVLLDNAITKPAMAVLLLLCDLINSQSGFAFPSHEWLLTKLSEAEGLGYKFNKRGVGNIVTALKAAGLIVASPSGDVGAGGHQGPTYALCPADGKNWHADLAWVDGLLGHEPVDEHGSDDEVERESADAPSCHGCHASVEGVTSPAVMVPTLVDAVDVPSCHSTHLNSPTTHSPTTAPEVVDNPAAFSSVRQTGYIDAATRVGGDHKSLDWFVAHALPAYLGDAIKDCRFKSTIRQHLHLEAKLNCCLMNGCDAAWIDDVLDRAVGFKFDPEHPRYQPPIKPVKPQEIVKSAWNAIVRALENVPGNEVHFAMRSKADQRAKNRAETKRPSVPLLAGDPPPF
jgi:hypothetical protein